MARPVWFVWSTGYKNDCALFETYQGAIRYTHNIPHTTHVDVQYQYRHHWMCDTTIRFGGFCGTVSNGPLWVVVTNGKAELYGTLADVVKSLTRKPAPPDASAWSVLESLPHHGHPDLPEGALFAQQAVKKTPRYTIWRPVCRVYRRLVQPDGAAYCAKVVEQVAADDILPVVGVPELVAEFL